MDARPGLLKTWLEVTLHPGRFFARPPEEQSRWRPLPFSLVVTSIAGLLGGLSVAATSKASLPETLALSAAIWLVAPLVCVVAVLPSAAIVHGFLICVRGRGRPFADTLRCVLYSCTTTIFGAIPVIGILVNLIWGGVILTVGLARTHGTSAGRAAVAIVGPPVYSIVLALLLRIFVMEAFKIPGGSMAPTLLAGDHMFVTKVGHRKRAPARGEVVVFIYPKEPDKDFVKRVVAIGGDRVDFRPDGQLVINGQPVLREPVAGPCDPRQYGGESDEPCQRYRETLDGQSYEIVQGTSRERSSYPQVPMTVPPGAAFLVGDNRDNSHDSRYWGAVPYALVKGKAWLVWWSQSGGQARLDRVPRRIHLGR